MHSLGSTSYQTTLSERVFASRLTNSFGFQSAGQSRGVQVTGSSHVLGKAHSSVLLYLLDVCARQLLFAFRAPAATQNQNQNQFYFRADVSSQVKPCQVYSENDR
jgi:hypothetical protein